MKKYLLAIIVALPLIVNGQAHLGVTLSGLKQSYPEKYFKIGYTNDGTKYVTTEQPLGTFVYYFDKETGLTNFCIQVPKSMQALNTQVEIYNKKYVIISETSWKAYLEGGGLMNIRLVFDEEYKLYVFQYTD